MGKGNKALAAAVAAALVSPLAMAVELGESEIGHTFMELDYRTVEGNEDGIALRGSIELMPQVHLLSNVHRVTDGALRRDQGTLAVGWHHGLMPSTDVIVRGGWTRARDRIGEDRNGFDNLFDFINGDEVTTAKDNGFVAQAGLRSMITRGLELNGYVQHEDLYGGNSAVAVGAVYNFTPRFGVSGLAEVGENDTVYELGLRVNFDGGPFGFGRRN